MHFEYNDKTQQLLAQVREFMIEHLYPNEAEMLAQIEEAYRALEPSGSTARTS